MYAAGADLPAGRQGPAAVVKNKTETVCHLHITHHRSTNAGMVVRTTERRNALPREMWASLDMRILITRLEAFCYTRKIMEEVYTCTPSGASGNDGKTVVLSSMANETQKNGKEAPEKGRPTALKDSLLTVFGDQIKDLGKEDAATLQEKYKALLPSPNWKASNSGDYLTLVQRAAMVHTVQPKVFERDFRKDLLPLLNNAVTAFEREQGPSQSETTTRNIQGFKNLSKESQRRHVLDSRISGYRNRMRSLGELLKWQTTVEGKRIFEESLLRNEATLRTEISDPRYLTDVLLAERQANVDTQRLRARINAGLVLEEQVKNPASREALRHMRKEGGKTIYETGSTHKKTHWEVLEISVASDAEGRKVVESELLFRCVDPVGAAFLLENIGGGLSSSIIESKAAESLRSYDQEMSPSINKDLLDYRLPRDVPLAHFRVFPIVSSDPLTWSKMLDGALLANAIQLRHTNIITSLPIFSEDPSSSLRTEILRAQKVAGAKKIHICIDIFSHGSEEGLGFLHPFTQNDLVALAQAFPDCSFTFNTIGCKGGGIRALLEHPQFRSSPDLQKRLSVFLQTKPSVNNLGDQQDVSGYYLHLMRGLMRGDTYGKAAHDADIEMKKERGIDAEAIIRGNLHSSRDSQTSLSDALAA